jgi:8-oxo-dGTP pyrophosphatase MutT (NUDIX family)
MPISSYLKNLRAKIGHDPVMMPAVCVIIFNEQGHVLLQRQRDDDLWHTLGGSMEPGEEPAAAAIREAKEEAGLDVQPERIVSIYSGPNTTYSNGDQVLYTSIAFACKMLPGQQPHIADDESLELRFFPPDALPNLWPVDRRAVEDAVANDPKTRFYL